MICGLQGQMSPKMPGQVHTAPKKRSPFSRWLINQCIPWTISNVTTMALTLSIGGEGVYAYTTSIFEKFWI